MSEIWDTVRNGEPLLNELVIDCHAHLGPHAQIDCSRGKCWEEDLLALMDVCGISKSIVSVVEACWRDAPRGNDRMAEIVAAHPGRFVGYTCVHARYSEEEMLGQLEKHLVRGNHKGIKIHPATNNYPANGPRYRPVWEFANERALPVLSHTWQGEPQDEPSIFVPIAREFPRVRVILGHSGGSLDGNEAAIEAAKQAPNIYLDLCCSLMPDGIIERMVKEVGADRVLFGTDASFFDSRGKIGQVAAARISDDDKRKILGLNAKRLFGI